MTVIGEAFVVLRPLATGFGTASKAAIDKELVGANVFGGLTTASGVAEQKIEQDASKGAGALSTAFNSASTKVGNSLTKIGESGGSFGLPFASSLKKIGGSLSSAQTPAKKLLDTMAGIGKIALGVTAVGAAAVAGESVHLASGLQQSDSEIAGHEHISVNAANNIGKSFTNSAFTSIFSANQMASAFAPVSGVLETLNGKALTVAQTHKFLAQSGTLAEATTHDLGATTKDVTAIMQGFHIPLSGTKKLTDELYQTSTTTGVGIDTLSSTIQRLKARLGVAAPSVKDLGGFLVDLNQHGVAGSRGLLVINSAANTLLNSVTNVDSATAKAASTFSTKLATAQASVTTKTNDVKKAQDALAAAQAKYQLGQQSGGATPSEIAAVQTATDNLTNAQQAQATAQGKVQALQATGAQTSNAQVNALTKLGLNVYNSKGQFVGFGNIIAQLGPKLQGLTQSQQLAALGAVFGKNANKALLDTVLAGSAGYDKAEKAVTRKKAAEEAANKQSKTLKRELDVLGAGLVDEGDKIGTFLIPKLETLAKWLGETFRWFQKHKDIALTLAGIIGGVLTATIAAFTIVTIGKWVNMLKSAYDLSSKLAGSLAQKVGGIFGGGNEEITQTVNEQVELDATAASEQLAETFQTAFDLGGAVIQEQIQQAFNLGGAAASTELTTGMDSAGLTAAADLSASMDTAGVTAAADISGSMDTSGVTAAADISSAMDAAGATAAEEIGGAEAAGGAAGGAAGIAGAGAGVAGLAVSGLTIANVILLHHDFNALTSALTARHQLEGLQHTNAQVKISQQGALAALGLTRGDITHASGKALTGLTAGADTKSYGELLKANQKLQDLKGKLKTETKHGDTPQSAALAKKIDELTKARDATAHALTHHQDLLTLGQKTQKLDELLRGGTAKVKITDAPKQKITGHPKLAVTFY